MTISPSSLGIAAGLAASTIWGGALAVTRLGVTGEAPFVPMDIAMLRFVGPALLLLPALHHAWPRIRQLPPVLMAILFAGGGAPFVLVAGSGLSIAGAAEAGALLPGTMPLCVALVSAMLGERFGAVRFVGLGLIGAAVAAVVVPALGAGEEGRWSGYALLLAAALLATGYTVALRRSGLGPWEATAFVSAASVVALAPAYLVTTGSAVLDAGWHDIAVQAAFQGIASGILAPVAFAACVQRLGAAQAAAFGSLAPGAACACGFVLLGEVPDGATAAAVLVSGLGVALVTRPAGPMLLRARPLRG